MMRPYRLAGLMIAAALMADSRQTPQVARPQAGSSHSEVPRAGLPFGVGEHLEYGVSGRVTVIVPVSGTATMDVLGTEPVRGEQALHIAFRIQGGNILYHVDTRY